MSTQKADKTDIQTLLEDELRQAKEWHSMPEEGCPPEVALAKSITLENLEEKLKELEKLPKHIEIACVRYALNRYKFEGKERTKYQESEPFKVWALKNARYIFPGLFDESGKYIGVKQ